MHVKASQPSAALVAVEASGLWLWKQSEMEMEMCLAVAVLVLGNGLCVYVECVCLLCGVCKTCANRT